MNTIPCRSASRVLQTANRRRRARTPRRLPSRRWHRGEHGQATAEYALLTGAVALVLGLVAAWAAGSGKIAALFDAVFDGLIRAAG